MHGYAVGCEQPRRACLFSLAALVSAPVLTALATNDLQPAKIDVSKAPDQRSYDPGDPGLRAAANALQRALNATTVEEEERLWTELIGTGLSSCFQSICSMASASASSACVCHLPKGSPGN